MDRMDSYPDFKRFKIDWDKKVNGSHVMLLNGTQPMTGNLNLANHKIINVAAPTQGGDLCTKAYTDGELAKKHTIGSVDVSNYLDVTKGGTIQKALTFASVHGADRQIDGLSDQPLNGTAAVNLNKLNTELGKKADVSVVTNGLNAKLNTYTFNTRIAAVTNAKVNKAGDTMTGTLAMGSNRVTSSHTATNDNDLVNRKFVEARFAHSLSASTLTNDLIYIMSGKNGEFSDEDDILGKPITYQKVIYETNKRTKPFELSLDTSKGFYSSRFGINLVSAAEGEYTLVCEMWWDSQKIDSSSVTLTASSTVETISTQRINQFPNQIVCLVHFTKRSSATPNDLMVDIVMKNQIQFTKYDKTLPVWVIVYGSKGYHNSIPKSVWTDWYSLVNSGVQINTKLILAKEPATASSATTKKYVDDKTEVVVLFVKKMAHNNNKEVSLSTTASDVICHPAASGGGYNTAFFSTHNNGRELNLVKKGWYQIMYTDLIIYARVFTIDKSEDNGSTWTEMDRTPLKGSSLFVQVNAIRIIQTTVDNTRIRLQIADSYFSGGDYASLVVRKLV